MPSSFGKKCELTTKLSVLNLSKNRITKFPERTIAPLIGLEVLLLEKNQITQIPFSLFMLTNLKILNIGENKLSTFPSNLMEGENSQKKEKDSNSENQLGLARLKKLQVFDVKNNTDLHIMPLELFSLGASLCQLNLRGIGLSALPTMSFAYVIKALGNVNFSSLTNLQAIDLSHNRLRVIPKQFWELKQLLILKLGYNQLTGLPPQIRNMTLLRALSLKG